MMMKHLGEPYLCPSDSFLGDIEGFSLSVLIKPIVQFWRNKWQYIFQLPILSNIGHTYRTHLYEYCFSHNTSLILHLSTVLIGYTTKYSLSKLFVQIAKNGLA